MQRFESKSKIFVVGLPRCGGQTITRALQMLFPNYPVWHSPGNAWSKMGGGFLAATEVFAPIPWLERRYPGSIYLYNDRDEESWFRSCQSVYGQSSQWNHPLWKYSLSQFMDYRKDYNFNQTSFNQSIPPERRKIINIIDNPNWAELCDALQLDPPNMPFPKIDQFKI